MIDLWIVEYLREKEREREERPFLEISIDPPPLLDVVEESEESPEESNRGVIIIDLL